MKCLKTNLMKFLMLPVDAKYVTCIAYNTQRTLVAIAIKAWVFPEFNSNHLTVLFYSIADGVFRQMKQYTIKATKGAQPVMPCYTNSSSGSKDKLKAGNL